LLDVVDATNARADASAAMTLGWGERRMYKFGNRESSMLEERGSESLSEHMTQGCEVEEGIGNGKCQTMWKQSTSRWTRIHCARQAGMAILES